MGHNSCWKTKKKNMQHYDMIANIYDCQYREEQRRKYKTALEALGVPKGGCILDVGCGTGLFIEEAAKLGGYVIGVDCSKNMVRRAKQEHGNGQVSLVCADADHLPFVDEAFGKVFSFTLLQNMPNPEETVVEICRVAKTGSEVILTATKKAFTKLSFLHLLDGRRLTIVKFIEEEGFKDYIAICKKNRNW